MYRGCMILSQQSNILTLLMKMNLSGLILFLLFCVSAAEQRQVVSLFTMYKKIKHQKKGKIIFQLLFFSDENHFIRTSPTTPRQDNVSTTTSTSTSSSLSLYFKQTGPLQVRGQVRGVIDTLYLMQKINSSRRPKPPSTSPP